MDVGDIHFYVKRWKEVEAVEREELRRLSIEQRWRQINFIWGMGMALGFSFESDESELGIFERWAKLKEKK